MSSSSKSFETIRVLSRLKSDNEVKAFILEIFKHGGRDITLKLVATVMSRRNAQRHDTKWIANEALKTLQPQVSVTAITYKGNLGVEYEACPVCGSQVEKGTLTTHYLSKHQRDQAIPKLRLLSNDLELNLLHSMQKTHELAKQLSLSITCPAVPLTMKEQFQKIEKATYQWQRCFHKIPHPSELEELRVKVMEVRFAIDESLCAIMDETTSTKRLT